MRRLKIQHNVQSQLQWLEQYYFYCSIRPEGRLYDAEHDLLVVAKFLDLSCNVLIHLTFDYIRDAHWASNTTRSIRYRSVRCLHIRVRHLVRFYMYTTLCFQNSFHIQCISCAIIRDLTWDLIVKCFSHWVDEHEFSPVCKCLGLSSCGRSVTSASIFTSVNLPVYAQHDKC